MSVVNKPTLPHSWANHSLHPPSFIKDIQISDKQSRTLEEPIEHILAAGSYKSDFGMLAVEK